MSTRKLEEYIDEYFDGSVGYWALWIAADPERAPAFRGDHDDWNVTDLARRLEGYGHWCIAEGRQGKVPKYGCGAVGFTKYLAARNATEADDLFVLAEQMEEDTENE